MNRFPPQRLYWMHFKGVHFVIEVPVRTHWIDIQASCEEFPPLEGTSIGPVAVDGCIVGPLRLVMFGAEGNPGPIERVIC